MDRRTFLQGGLAASFLFLPDRHAWVWAQSDGVMKLLRAPKVALVIGNSGYQSVPALRNAGNDAKAIADTLQKAGFEVTEKLDAGRDAMLEAVQAYTQTLAKRKCVGLFYFAGHGVQLAWSNYLLPVDAVIGKVEDVATRCVPVDGLVGGITKAANPMNVIILDACRENPFGSDIRMERKGLSQMDAPPSTLLAYATSPGNLASDGAGANGLYTENLIREMAVRETKIEDVFKRVRLSVRRASNGAQIPWESTSLEEDFYFIPPDSLAKRSAEEEEKLFAEELAIYEKAKQSPAPAPVEAYLRRFPSGRFAELAQLRLDRLLAAQGERPVEIAPAQGNPHTLGTVRADTKFRIGDEFVYNSVDRISGGTKERVVTVVTAITDTQVIFNDGKLILDLQGNTVQLPDGRRFSPRQDQALEYTVGKRWTTRYTVSKGGVNLGFVDAEFKVAARERINVPAGTFDCFRIEAHGHSRLPGRPAAIDVHLTHWMAPNQVRRAIAREECRRGTLRGHVRELTSERMELVSFKQG